VACSCTSLGSLIKDRVENCPEVRFVSLTLIIGNHNYSSWSLRLWLYLKESQLDSKEGPFQIPPVSTDMTTMV